MERQRIATQKYVTRKMDTLKAFISVNQRELPDDLNLDTIQRMKSEKEIYTVPIYFKIISGLRRFHYADYTHYAIKILRFKNRSEYIKHNRKTLKELKTNARLHN